MIHSKFVHLHVHTEYSLLDGAARLNNLLDRAAELRMPALAITDHGTMSGAIDFYKKAIARGIKPIIGEEMYIAPGSRFDKKAFGVKDAAYHLVLLARDEKGYKNLMKLSSIAYLEGFYYKPRIDKEVLERYSGGLIGLSGCLKGEVSSRLLAGQDKKAREAAGTYNEILGDGNFFLELHDHGMEEQALVNRGILEMSRDLSIPVVAANDCHYIYREDAYSHDILLCVQTGKTLDAEKRMKMFNDQFYLKSEEEMREIFAEVPEAIKNTIEITNRCNLELQFGQDLLPHYHPPDGKRPGDYLRELCMEGLERRYPGTGPDIMGRLNHELGIIEHMNFASYFLIVWDFIRYARSVEIPVGPGRGSAAGSIVAYVLGITDIDPLRYNLLFERFLNPDRVTLPDIDMDFCYDRRNEILDYVVKKYGVDNVAQIITFGTMKARAAVRDVGRVLGMPYAEVDKIAKLIPAEPRITLADALLMEPALKQRYDKEEGVKKLIDIAQKIEGFPRNASTHAAGVVISDRPLTEHIPLCKGKEDEVITQYSMKPIEEIGLLKMDFLGLRTLTVISDTLKIIERTRGTKLTKEAIPLDDPGTYELLNKANTIGVFQLESSGMRDLAKKIGINSFEDITALLALFRPGPMHMLNDYVKRKHGRGKIKYEHPKLEPILRDTYGVMLYQEQVMQCAHELAGFSLSEADNLRRIMGKKIVREIGGQKEHFVKGAEANGVKKAVAERIFEKMARFAEYGFNKSHSAAYALIAYRTAYLKANYPVEYMAALLSSEINNKDQISKYIAECKSMGINILPPDVNESFAKFTVVGKGIRFGLAAVKNVGILAVRSIIEVRKSRGPFTSFYDFVEHTDSRHVNRRTIESMIKCGAFDSMGPRRAQLMEALDDALNAASYSQRSRQNGQATFLDIFKSEESYKRSVEKLPDVPEWPDNQLLAQEKELLGFYVTGHPLAKYEGVLRKFATCTTTELAEMGDGDEISIGGIINKARFVLTKKKSEKMAILLLEDLEGVTEVPVFPGIYRENAPLIEEDKPVLIKGRVSFKEDIPKVVADSIYALDDAEEKLTSSVHIDLHQARVNDGTIEKLNELLKGNPGKCPVFLDFSFSTGEKLLMRAGVNLRVTPSRSLVERVEELLGEETVQLRT